MPNAVLVVDMLRGFLEPGYNLYCGDAARSIIPNVRELLKRETEAGSQIGTSAGGSGKPRRPGTERSKMSGSPITHNPSVR